MSKSNSLISIKKNLKSLANPQKAVFLQRYFKTGKGEYGQGDVFLGLTVPQTRTIAKKHSALSSADIETLIKSVIHEERQIALMILVARYKKATEKEKEEIFKFYLAHTGGINNWDLVDGSAAYIVGPFLEQREKALLEQLAVSNNIWERRIAMLSTLHFIKEGKSEEAFAIAKLLLHDSHDLIHKAVGWMLREVGKCCGEEIEENFLKKYYKEMPRTMLRYAIERFSKQKRKSYLYK